MGKVLSSKLPYKVEAKGSLWSVTFESGCYSSWNIEHHVFSGNTPEEVWEFVKVWAKSGGLDSWRSGLVWGTRKFVFGKTGTDFYSPSTGGFWETDYGDSLKVDIERLNVVVSRPEKLESDFIGEDEDNE